MEKKYFKYKKLRYNTKIRSKTASNKPQLWKYDRNIINMIENIL